MPMWTGMPVYKMFPQLACFSVSKQVCGALGCPGFCSALPTLYEGWILQETQALDSSALVEHSLLSGSAFLAVPNCGSFIFYLWSEQ
jgi:hypothetical protein